MKCTDDHHNYELEGFEDKNLIQVLRFIKKEPVEGGGEPGELKTVHDGTTNEEVLEMLIHRLTGLYGKFQSIETANAIISCQEALDLLNKRTEDRKARGVEGKQLT